MQTEDDIVSFGALKDHIQEVAQHYRGGRLVERLKGGSRGDWWNLLLLFKLDNGELMRVRKSVHSLDVLFIQNLLAM